MTKPPIRQSLLHYAQGLLMGGADIIPGVSGGTMALIVGIYARLIDSISSAFSVVLAALRFDYDELWHHWREVEWHLVVPLLLGVASAILIASQFIPTLLEQYPHQMRGLFFGLVAASIIVPWLRMGRFTIGLFIVALAAALAAFFIVGLPALEVTAAPNLWRVFFSASVAICAMILPGVSGAFLLEVLGIYKATTEALKNAEVTYVLVFCAGAAIGLGLFSKVLDYLLDHYHDTTMAALIGLMAGSLRALWPWQPWDGHARTLLWPTDADPFYSVLLLGLAGFAFIALITWWGHRRIEESASAS